jgi:hypothetical protein
MIVLMMMMLLLFAVVVVVVAVDARRLCSLPPNDWIQKIRHGPRHFVSA